MGIIYTFVTLKSIKMDIAKRIKTIREKKGMSQKELITAVGLGAPMYSRIETGKAEPSLTTLEKIAKALGVKLVDFFDADDNLEDINSYDASLMEKVKTIEELNADEKKMVFAFVDALVGKKKLKDALSNVLTEAH